MSRYPRGSKVIHLGTSGYYVLVDAEDWDWLSSFHWYAHHSRGGVYARGRVGGRKVFLHGLLTGGWLGRHPEGLQTDHVNRDTLDNRRSNLRLVTPGENASNRRARS